MRSQPATRLLRTTHAQGWICAVTGWIIQPPSLFLGAWGGVVFNWCWEIAPIQAEWRVCSNYFDTSGPQSLLGAFRVFGNFMPPNRFARLQKKTRCLQHEWVPPPLPSLFKAAWCCTVSTLSFHNFLLGLSCQLIKSRPIFQLKKMW